MKRKILFVYDSMMMGGTTSALLSLLGAIDYSKYDVDLLLYTNDGPLQQSIPDSVNVLKQAFVGNNYNQSRLFKIILTLLNGNFFRWIFCLFKYRHNKNTSGRRMFSWLSVPSQVSLSRKLEILYDVAIGFMEGWSDAYVVSSKVQAKKKMGWIHPDYSSAGLIKEGDYKVLGKLDYITTVSETNRKNLQSIYPEFSSKIVCIRNILPIDEIIAKSQKCISDFISESRFVLGTVCRIDFASKGLDRAIRVMAYLQDKEVLEDFCWIIIGNGPDYDKLQSLIDQYKLRKKIVCLGEKENPYPYYKLMDAFFLPSIYEGCPVVIDEAMALGIPCIVTNYSTAREQIQNGVNGYIIDNDEKSLCEKMEQLLKDRSMLSRLSCKNDIHSLNVKYYQKIVEIFNEV